MGSMVSDHGRPDTVTPGSGEPMVGGLDADELAARLARQRRPMAVLSVDEFVAMVVGVAPPLSQTQVQRLRRILLPEA
jgi:hypothetical protein